MSELDVSHFRKVETTPVVDSSTDAPPRPRALGATQVPNEADDSFGPTASTLSDVEILPPGASPVIQSTEPQLNLRSLQVLPYQRIPFHELEDRQSLMRELNDSIPLNDFNLPRYFYRPDLLDVRLIADTARSAALLTLQPPNGGVSVKDLLENATIQLDYHHGYPTLRTGQPFWSQLAFESADAFQAFVAYLDQPGARTFQPLNAWPIEMLAEWFHLYSWSYRTRAYDMFRTTHHARMRVHRIMSTEDDHYLESQKLFRKISRALDGKTDEDLSNMDAGDLVNMLEKIVKMQRVSAGLPAAGAPDQKQQQAPTSVEVHMRQLAKSEGGEKTVVDEVDSMALLGDLDALNAAQELIVKIKGG